MINKMIFRSYLEELLPKTSPVKPKLLKLKKVASSAF
jgi:hypothetical protein